MSAAVMLCPYWDKEVTESLIWSNHFVHNTQGRKDELREQKTFGELKMIQVAGLDRGKR